MRYFFVLLLLLSGVSFAKRQVPDSVTPVIYDGIKYEVVPWSFENGTKQNGGFVRAVEVSTGKVIWAKQIYKTKYDRNPEKDMQDVFIVDLKISPEDGVLVIVNEAGIVYRVGLSDGNIKK
ncbi:MAG: hypothetical protein CMI02_13390 [Oceanospirillaceae bacterium]|nr:hypothetical protein [Oceanospirillaceae bacterium]MBT13015.1 hypothetical protein [Oceanospirillaceae bacterium]|tara:strand:+ start:2566 stop:2928 length:363 start_codon:yes stop_codon:yes gene_type:complete